MSYLLFNQHPYVSTSTATLGAYNTCMSSTPWKPGHFYSPFPSDKDIEDAVACKRVFEFQPQDNINSGDLDFNLRQILLEGTFLLPKFLATSNSMYPIESRQFTLADALTLFCVILKNKPQKIIEIGSGHSSALMVDIRNFLNIDLEITCIEPFPTRLRETLGSRIDEIELKEMVVQEVEKEFWHSLDENCLIFIDSSHVSKAGSDVNYLFFNVLPNLKKGSIIHVHDIFRGFEYPEKWLREGRAWNEAYLLRAFLMFNNTFEIFLWPQASRVSEQIDEISKILEIDFPFPGSSIYLRKIQ
jgi:hypothetical protein